MLRMIFFLMIFATFGVFSRDFTQIGFNISQSTSNDWKNGKRSSVELFLSYKAIMNYKIDTLKLRTNIDCSIGFIYEESEKLNIISSRPTANKLFGEEILIYPLGWTLDPFLSASVRTQFTESIVLAGKNEIKNAKFWDPSETALCILRTNCPIYWGQCIVINLVRVEEIGVENCEPPCEIGPCYE